MLRALAHAVVHVVALGCNDPVLPLNVSELDVEVFLAADADVVTTAQRALAQGVLGFVVTETHLRHQEGLLGCVRFSPAAQVLAPILTVHFQV
ncbi:hypothetical protein AOLI_G00011340 [Acnodon oligacanthus]